MADGCLISTPTLGRAKSTIVPHWMLWLSAYIERQGHHVDVVDVKSKINAEPSRKKEESVFHETVEKAIASGSSLIGLSGFTEDYRNLETLARAIKQKSNAKIIVGGIHATVSPEDYFIAVIRKRCAPMPTSSSTPRRRRKKM